MSDFDIKNFKNFRPARMLCQQCKSLISTPFEKVEGEDYYKCPVCKVKYFPTDEYVRAEDYLSEMGYGISFDDLMGHAQRLARIASMLNTSDFLGRRTPPMKILIEALNQAQQFVHFVTYGISDLHIGLIKMVANRINVRGIISNIDDRKSREFVNHRDEAPLLSIRRYGVNADCKIVPHQKIIIIDGLLAFKGSANLTLNSWRKAGNDRDIIETETNIKKVIELNNRYFSSIWKQEASYGTEIEMASCPF